MLPLDPNPPRLARVRRALAGLQSGPWARPAILTTLAIGLAAFAFVADLRYPTRHWLLWPYLAYNALAAVFCGACLTCGWRVLKLLRPGLRRLADRVLLAFAVGVLLFAWGVFVGGLLGAYGSVFFVALPLLFFSVGARAVVRDGRRIVKALTRHRSGSEVAAACLPRSWSQLGAFLLLTAGVLAVYSHVLAPDNVSFDARWYHLPIAEHYWAAGRLRPYPEGWYLGAYPQLASLLYCWAFQIPKGGLFNQVTLALHLEWALFLWTLAGVGVLARRLLPGVPLRFAAAAVFLFPSILVYDSNLNGGADHINAFWAAPLVIAFINWARRPSPRGLLLVSAVAAGAFLTKYQALYVALPVALGVVAVAARRRCLGSLLPALLAELALTAPHWLKNWIAYGDPFFPMLWRWLKVRPFYAGAGPEFTNGDLFPPHFLMRGVPLWMKIGRSLRAMATFAFEPHDWWPFHRDWPTFGALFTILLLPLCFLRTGWRALRLAAATELAIFVWYFTNHQDRFLQVLLPWMAAVTAVAIALLVRRGRAERAAVSLVIAYQLIWGADLYFLPTHAVMNEAPIRQVAIRLGQGFEQKFDERFDYWSGDRGALGKGLPRDAVVVLHEQGMRLGLQRMSMSDGQGWQGAISYRELGSASAAWAQLRALGATHVMWEAYSEVSATADVIAREAVFAALTTRATDEWKRAGDLTVARLTPVHRPGKGRERILVAGCGSDPPAGMYEPEPHAAPVPLRSVRDRSRAPATVVAVRPRCGRTLAQVVSDPADFELIATCDGMEFWARRSKS